MPTVISAKDGQAYLESVDTSIEASRESLDDTVYTPIYIRVYNEKTESVDEYELEEYTSLALSALTDIGFEPEALKAQAVAIRSVICYRHENPDHKGFEICTDAEHCFPLAERAREDCISAVEETRGLALTYEGRAALALSHLSSCISTESHFAVYGESMPYLTSVSVFNESDFAYYKTVKSLSAEEYKNAFSAYNTDFDSNPYFDSVCFTEGNRVYTINAGGLCFKGSTFARLFQLPSTCFSVTETKNGFEITCYGNGNGVGMSRLSAFLMAKDGEDFKSILQHFYPGTELSHICAA